MLMPPQKAQVPPYSRPGYAHQNTEQLRITPHAAIIVTVLITIDGMRPFESDAFYGPINVGGLK
jgi:hypothetical protein